MRFAVPGYAATARCVGAHLSFYAPYDAAHGLEPKRYSVAALYERRPSTEISPYVFGGHRPPLQACGLTAGFGDPALQNPAVIDRRYRRAGCGGALKITRRTPSQGRFLPWAGPCVRAEELHGGNKRPAGERQPYKSPNITGVWYQAGFARLFSSCERQRVDESPLAGARGYVPVQSPKAKGDWFSPAAR